MFQKAVFCLARKKEGKAHIQNENKVTQNQAPKSLNRKVGSKTTGLYIVHSNVSVAVLGSRTLIMPGKVRYACFKYPGASLLVAVGRCRRQKRLRASWSITSASLTAQG